ncbi:MAG: hypothetical protein Q8O93_01700 [bacterium]|nr:hypothetical protein [bacterium]
MKVDAGPEKLGDLLKLITKKPKPPAYAWQDLALRVITELAVPDFKRSSVFKACKQKPRIIIEQALNDTKELCHDGENWKYFFKIIGDTGLKGGRPKL